MGNFDLEDRRLLADSVVRLMSEACGFERLKARLAAGLSFDEPLWTRLFELGLMTLLVPVARGGMGGGAVELVAVARAMGPGLLQEPFLSTAVLALPLLAELEGEASGTLDEALGERWPMALAFAEPQLGFARGPVETRAEQRAGEWVVRGLKSAVLDAGLARAFLVTARDSQGLGVYLVARGAQGLSMTTVPTVDARGTAGLALQDTPARRIGSGDASRALEKALDLGALAVCAEAVGAMSTLVELTGNHLKVRRQFGRALAEFQALQHRIVEMYVHAEESAAAVEAAAGCFDGEESQRARWVSIAKAQCARSGRYVSQQAIQLHGGLGMTAELSVSHYFKRLMMLEALFGDAEFHVERYRALRMEAGR